MQNEPNRVTCAIAVFISNPEEGKITYTKDTMRIATDALQVYRGRGYLENYAVAKLFRDAKLFQIYEGTSQVQRQVIARYLFEEYQLTIKGI